MKPRILVVEDNPLNRELLCDWIETEGYEVASTADLKIAFELVRSQKPQAVLLDIQVGAERRTSASDLDSRGAEL